MFAPREDASRKADGEEEGSRRAEGNPSMRRADSLWMCKQEALPVSATLAGEHRPLLGESSAGGRSQDQGPKCLRV